MSTNPIVFIGGDKYKLCYGCGETKEISDYNKLTVSNAGVQVYCKDCQKRRYNSDASYSNHIKRWKRDPVVLLVERYNNRAKSINVEYSLSYDDVKKLTSGICHYCGSKPQPNKHGVVYNGIDRIDSSLGYTKDNSTSCCTLCNRAKMELSKDMFLDMVKRIYEYSIRKEK